MKNDKKSSQSKQSEQVVKEEKKVVANGYNPKINNVYRSEKGLQILLENVEIVYSNLNKPYHSKEYDSYSSSVRILLNDKLKKELLNLFEVHFKNEKHLPVAMDDWITKKVDLTKEETPRETFYANWHWKKNGNVLRPAKALDVTGIREGEKFPFSFFGDVQLGFVFSGKFTFSCYLNGVVVKKVISQESSFTGFKAEGTFSPTVEIDEQEESETVEEEVRKFKAENPKGEGESFVGKVKRNLWGK